MKLLEFFKEKEKFLIDKLTANGLLCSKRVIDINGKEYSLKLELWILFQYNCFFRIIVTFVGIDIRIYSSRKMEKSILESLTGMKLAFFISILSLGIPTFLKDIGGFEKRKKQK